MRKAVCFLGLVSALQLAVATESPRPVIPPSSHFTIATPGAPWLNVSRPLTTDDLRNRVILLDFWTYGCINCIQAIPEIAKLEKEFRDDLVIIGVHSAKFDTEKETDQIRQAVIRYGIEHPVVNDRDFRIWRTFEVRSWPTFVLLQPNGEVAKVYTGEGHTGDLRKAIREILKATPTPTKVVKSKLPVELERDKTPPGEFLYPSKLAYDAPTKTLFVADTSHHQIAAYTWDPSEPARLKPAFRIGKRGEAGLKNGAYGAARFRRPQGIAVGKNVLYVADTENHVVRKIDLKAKTVSTVAGTGMPGNPKTAKNMPAASTPIASPWDVAFHPDEDHLVIAVAGVHQLWSLDLKSARLTSIAGSGAEGIDDGLYEESNTLAQPSGLSSLLGSLYFLDAESSSLRFYFETYVRTLVGSGLFDFGYRDGERKKAKLQHPLGVFADVTGVYIADTLNHAIRRYEPAKQTLETVVGDGRMGRGSETAPEEALKTRLNEPAGITKVGEGLFVIADTGNHRLLLWNRGNGKVERLKVDGEVSALPEANASAAIAAPKRFSLRLPNTQGMPDATVGGANVALEIALPENHKINAEAPSFARLFEGGPPKEKLKQEWKSEDLRKSKTLSLADLKEGTDYFFQGTFYFCTDAKNSVCEIASVSFPIRRSAGGADRVTISLRSVEKK